MTILNVKSMGSKKKYSYLFVLIFLILLNTQIECIKFGRNKPSKTQETEHKDISNVETQKAINEQTAKTNNQNTDQNKKEKSEMTQSNPELTVKEEKTLENKLEQTFTTIGKLESQLESLVPVEELKAVDSLFETENSKTEKLKTEKSPLTITPEKTSIQNEVQPSTVPEIEPSKQQSQQKESILEGLFKDDILNKDETGKNKEEEIEKNKETLKAISEPEKDKSIKENQKVSSRSPEKEEEKSEEGEKDKKVKTEEETKQEKEYKKLSKVEENEEEEDEDEENNKEDKEDEEEQEEDDVIYSKNTKKENKKSAEPHIETESKYSFTLLLTFILYSFIIVMVIVTIKCTTSSSKATKAVNIMVDAVGDAFKKKQGYRPALNEEEITEREDEITVGYTVDDNKQIFWEKNSVEGI